jgi:hypothetical protein
MKIAMVVLALLLFAGAASADSIWTYAGNSQNGPNVTYPNPNPCNCALSGSVTFNDSWQPLSWSFTDGLVTATNLNSTAAFNPFEYSGPAFSTWRMLISGLDGNAIFLSQFYGSIGEATDSGDNWFVQGNHGVWVDGPVSTPEPGVGILLAIGVVMAGSFLIGRGYEEHKRLA